MAVGGDLSERGVDGSRRLGSVGIAGERRCGSAYNTCAPPALRERQRSDCARGDIETDGAATTKAKAGLDQA